MVCIITEIYFTINIMNNQIRSGEQNELEDLLRLAADTRDIVGHEKLILKDPQSPNIVYTMWTTKRSINFSIEKPNTERTHFELYYDESQCVLGKKTDNYNADLQAFENGNGGPIATNAAEVTQWLKETLSIFQKPKNSHDWHSDAIAFAIQS